MNHPIPCVGGRANGDGGDTTVCKSTGDEGRKSRKLGDFELHVDQRMAGLASNWQQEMAPLYATAILQVVSTMVGEIGAHERVVNGPDNPVISSEDDSVATRR